MKERTKNILIELGVRYPALQPLLADVEDAFEAMKACYEQGGRLYLCGNGGSSSDCEHIVGELMKSFKKKRPLPAPLVEGLQKEGELGEEMINYLEGGLPAISLCGHSSLTLPLSTTKIPCSPLRSSLALWAERGTFF